MRFWSYESLFWTIGILKYLTETFQYTKNYTKARVKYQN